MKKLLCLALVLTMCVSLFAGCGKYDMESADLKSFVTLGDVDALSYDELAKRYEAYRVNNGKAITNFYMSTGYTIGFEVTAEILNDDGSYRVYEAFTHTGDDYVKDYDMYRYQENSVFDTGLTYALEDATKETKTPRLIYLDKAFSFTMPISESNEHEEVAGKTVKFTVTVKEVLPTEYGDSLIMDDLKEFYNKYAAEKTVIEMGDSVQIDFTGKIDGALFDGGKMENYVLIVGKGGLVDGFEEQLVGHKKGEKFDITVTFPEDYEDDALAGKEAVFSIKVDEVANDNAIISENTPFADIFELKEYYRIKLYIEYAIVDYVADISTCHSLPEKLVDDFKKIYEDAVKRNITESIVAYAERGETYSKAEMKEKLYPNGSDKTYIEKMAKDAAYDYILVHLLMEKFEITYTDAQYERDVRKIAEEYSSYYNQEYTPKQIKKLMGEEILRLSFMDALVTEKLIENIVGAPEFRVIEE